MMTEAVSPDKDVMMALGSGTPGVRSNVKKNNTMKAVAAAGIQAFFKRNIDPIVSHGVESFSRILSTIRSSREAA